MLSRPGTHFFGGVELALFFFPKILLKTPAVLFLIAVALPFITLPTSAVMTGLSAVPVMLIGIPLALEGFFAADELFRLVRILTPTLLSPFALVTFEIK